MRILIVRLIQVWILSLFGFPWVGLCQARDDLAQVVKRANAAMQQNRFEEAEGHYRAALALAPDLAEIRSNLGVALHSQRKYGKAEKEFRRALAANPRLFVPNYFLGIELFKTNRYREARTCLEAALVIKPTDMESRRWLGATLIGLRDYDGGLRQYHEVLRLNPKDIDSLYSIGKIYLNLMEHSLKRILNSPGNRYYGLTLVECLAGGEEWRELVEKELPRIIQVEPSAPLLRYELAKLYLKGRRIEEARSLFEEELKMDPCSFQARYGLAQVCLMIRQYEGFSHELENAIRIRPEFFCPLPPLFGITRTDLEGALQGAQSRLALEFLAAQLGRSNSFCAELAPFKHRLAASDKDVANKPDLLFRQKRYEAAIAGFETLGLGSDDLSTRFLLANAYLETSNWQAVVKLAESLASDPEFKIAADYLFTKGYQSLATRALAELERIAPDSYRAHQLRGETFYARQNMRQAIGAFKTALEQEPSHADLLYQLGRAHYLLGEFSQAFEALERSIQIDPYNAEANFLVGEGLVYTQEAERAVPFLLKTLELDPVMLKAHGELGKAYVQLSQWEKAARELELASSDDSGGELHYQLFRAYSRLNQKDKAQEALAHSNRLRGEKIARERQKIAVVAP